VLIFNQRPGYILCELWRAKYCNNEVLLPPTEHKNYVLHRFSLASDQVWSCLLAWVQ